MRTLIVEDSSLYRKLLTDVLAELPEISCADLAQTGHIALRKADDLRPDLILLDMELPDMSGLDVIRQLRADGNMASVVVVSGSANKHSGSGAKAMAYGATDIITKPSGSSADETRRELIRQLRPVVAAVSARTPRRDCYPAPQIEFRPSLRRDQASEARGVHCALSQRPAPKPPSIRSTQSVNSILPPTARMPKKSPEVVAIGASTGGPEALLKMLEEIPEQFRLPIVMAVHTKPGFSKTLAGLLDRRSKLKVVEGKDGDVLKPGVAYLAPGGMQMRVENTLSGDRAIRVCDDAPENFCKPSVDYLFRAVGKTFQDRALYVILTGMGSDGTQGLVAARRYDCRVIAQDEASCVVFGMPGEAIRANVVDLVAPLDKIVGHIVRMVGK